MKLKFNITGKHQADPFIFEDNGKLFLYVTADDGVEAYSAGDLFGTWKFEGIVTRFKKGHNFWAPSVIKYDGKYYMYVSCVKDDNFQFMHAAYADSPLGPFAEEKCLYDYFSIDSHVVQTEAGLFLWYAKNNEMGERIGTRIFVDRLIDPYTPAYCPKEAVLPTFDEEIFRRNIYNDGRNWHTIEGPFWFTEGEWQYVMYSGGCYKDDTYHIGYSAAKTNESDLTKVKFVKHTDNGKFAPLLIKNTFEEGTGHHSVIKYKGEYYAIYHGRDYCKTSSSSKEYIEARTARVCRLIVNNGIITAQRFENNI